jgi:hypothetical protein
MCVNVAIVADVQTGHEAALWPPDYVLANNTSINISPAQEVLLEYWHDFWTQPDVKDAEYVIHLAEPIEGNNKKNYGRSLVTPDLDEQTGAHVHLIKPYLKDKKIFLVKGSRYHSALETDVEKTIADRLTQEGFIAEYCGDIANLKIGKTGHIIWATHKGGDAMLYRSTMLDRNSLYFSAIKSKLKEDMDVIIYGHHHMFFRVDTPSRINLIAPTWKFWHPIKGAAKFPYTQPTIGGLCLHLKPNRGSIHIEKHFYPLQHIYSALRNV